MCVPFQPIDSSRRGIRTLFNDRLWGVSGSRGAAGFEGRFHHFSLEIAIVSLGCKQRLSFISGFSCIIFVPGPVLGAEETGLNQVRRSL